MGLAPLLVRQVAQTILRPEPEGVTVLLVEQMASMALAVADRAYVIQNGLVRSKARALAWPATRRSSRPISAARTSDQPLSLPPGPGTADGGVTNSGDATTVRPFG